MKVFSSGVDNLAQLIRSAVERAPTAPYGTDAAFVEMQEAMRVAEQLARRLGACGIHRKSRIAFVGPTSENFLIMWMASQLSGVQVALINPHFPPDLIGEMLDDLSPAAIVLFDDVSMAKLKGLPWPIVDARGAWKANLEISGIPSGPSDILDSWEPNGVNCVEADIACYVHTSGTSGRPKFCALSHGYFLRLGRFVADTMGYATNDVVFAPMPMFHINPLGYGVVSAWTAGAGVLGTEKFSVSKFWGTAKTIGATSVVLHFAAMKMVLESTERSDSTGHRIRSALCVDSEFLRKFDVAIGTTAYGSTEAGGLCHMWHVRAGDTPPTPEGELFYGGRARFDVEARISDSGEILVRELAPNALFSGYLRDSGIDPAKDEDGWFHTGDRGRMDDVGGLVFIERMSESIRVNGEYVPVDYVERHLQATAGIKEFAIWSRPDAVSGQQVVLWVTDADFDTDRMADSIKLLPKFMRPVEIVVIANLPRDSGVNKIQRRRLSSEPALSSFTVTADSPSTIVQLQA